MLFLNSIIKFLFSPEIFLILLLTFAFLLKRKERVRNILLTVSALWLFLIYVSPLPLYLTESWERKYPAFNLHEHKELINFSGEIHILVLGAGFTNDPEISLTSKLGENIAMRLMEGIRIYNLMDTAKLISSGAALKSEISQAEAVADAAVSLGVSPQDTLYLPNTLNTESEAYSYTRRFNSPIRQSVNPVILVTSAVHMRRAVYWFNYYGIDVIPAPCNYLFKEDPLNPEFKWKPSWEKVKMLDKVMDEWLGLLWGRLKSSN